MNGAAGRIYFLLNGRKWKKNSPPLPPSGLPRHLLLVSRTEAAAQISIQPRSRRTNADAAPGGPICRESVINPGVFIFALGALVAASGVAAAAARPYTTVPGCL